MTTYTFGSDTWTNDFKQTELLEMAAVSCLVSNIQEKKCIIKSIDLRFSNNKIRINIFCDKNAEKEVSDIVNNCYILKIINLEKVLNFI